MTPRYVELLSVAYAQGLLAWGATFLLHSAVLLIGAGLIVRLCRPRIGIEEILWRTALLAPALTATARVAVGMTLHTPGWRAAAAPMADVLAAHTWAATALAGSWIAWVAVASMLGLLRIIVERRRLGPRTPGAPPWADLTAAGIAQPGRIRFTTSPQVRSPVVIGMREVCLPADGWLCLSEAQRRAVLAHEIAHLRRHDPVWRLLESLVCLLLPFQPFARRVWRRLLELAEYACDDVAVRLTGARRPLAEALARLAPMRWESPVCAPGFVSGESRLVRRVRRLSLDAGDPGRTGRATAAAAATIVLLAVAGPSVRANLEGAADRLPWLTPTRSPTPAAVDVLRRERVIRRALRDAQRNVLRRLP